MKSLEHPGLKLIIYGAVLQFIGLILKGQLGLTATLVGIIMVVAGFVRVVKDRKKP